VDKNVSSNQAAEMILIVYLATRFQALKSYRMFKEESIVLQGNFR